MKVPTIALAMIVKDDSEAKDFERLLKSLMPHVDGLYVAVTGISGKHDKIHKLVKQYKGTSVSTSPETHPQLYIEENGKHFFGNFAEARNVSFDLVPANYDYITWADVDDVVMGAHELPDAAKYMQEHNLDMLFFNYLYAVILDEKGQIKDVEIEHMKERLFKNGMFKWISRLHEVPVAKEEGYEPSNTRWDHTRNKQCKWVHLSEDEKVHERTDRNRRILELQAKEEKYQDPRTLYHLVRMYWEEGHEDAFGKAKTLISEYLKKSGWDAQRADILEYLGMILEKEGQLHKAAEVYHRATWEYPSNIVPYLRLASVYYQLEKDEFADHWLDTALRMEIPPVATTISNPHQIKLLASTLKLNQAIRRGDTKARLEWAQKRAALMGKDDGVLEEAEMHEYTNEAARGLLKYAKYLHDIEEFEKIEKLLETVPRAWGGLPFVQTIANKIGKAKKWPKGSIVYFASFGSPHFEEWDWRSLEKGIGGSETAVIQLTERWAKEHDVTVYCEVEEETVSPNGVKYKPYYTLNWNDEFDTVILWRASYLLDKEIKAKRIFYDAHDVESQMAWTDKRMEKVDKVFFKTQYHRNMVPKLPNEKARVISNGISQ